MATSNVLEGKSLPIYGNSSQIRDWLYVDNHAKVLRLVLEKRAVGEAYNIDGHCEKINLEVVKAICLMLDEQAPDSKYRPHE